MARQNGKGALKVLGSIGEVLQENQILSKILKRQDNEHVKTAGEIAEQFGLGKRRVRSRQSGKGIGSALMSAGRYIKNHRLVSRGLRLIPHPVAQKASAIAHMIGLGPKKRRVRRTQNGKGFIKDLLSEVGGGVGGGMRGLFGAGRKKRIAL
jgi:hypothetical protein